MSNKINNNGKGAKKEKGKDKMKTDGQKQPEKNLQGAESSEQSAEDTSENDKASKDIRPDIQKTLTDFGNADRFLKQHGNDVKYCPDQSTWYYYSGQRWVQDTKKTVINRKAKKTIKSIYSEAEDESLTVDEKIALRDHTRKSSTPGKIRAMLESAQCEPDIIVTTSELDRDPLLLNCDNGVLGLTTGQLQDHKKEDLLTKIVPVPYDPDATCPRWVSFLLEITGNNQDLTDFLQRVVGYMLTGKTSEHCLFILHGNGANGKSTFIELLRNLLGDYAMHATSSSFLHRLSAPIRNDIARLQGARFVSAVEIGMGKKLDEALVKQLTGGDQVTARFLYQEYFEFKPQFKIFLVANYRPEIRGTDKGIWRRINLIPFDMSIASSAIDKDLQSKLNAELSGILAWAVQGCLEWQRQGLNPPQEVKTATNDYREEMDFLKGFLDDCCSVGSDNKVPLADLYIAYREWSENACLDAAGKKIFGGLMKQRGYTQNKSGSVRSWSGISLKKEIKEDKASETSAEKTEKT